MQYNTGNVPGKPKSAHARALVSAVSIVKKKSSANALLPNMLKRLRMYDRITSFQRDHSAGYSFVDPFRDRGTGVLSLNVKVPPLLVGPPASQL